MKGKARRLLSWVCVLALCMSLLPVTALAAPGSGNTSSLEPADKHYTLNGKEASSDADITLSKTAVDKGDGTYEVTLSATAKRVVTAKPTEVVFVIDGSGSMNWCEDKPNEGNTGYIGPDKKHYHGNDNTHDHPYCTLVENDQKESRWDIALDAIETMMENLGNEGISYKFVVYKGAQKHNGEWYTYAKNYNNFAEVQKISPLGGTPLTEGVDVALDQFEDSNSNQVMIIVADGASDRNQYPNNQASQFKKEGGEIYTVGFTFSSDTFNNLSNGPGYYFTANDADQLKLSMEQISENIKGLISDPLGDKVELVGGVKDIQVSYQGSSSAGNLWVTGDTINWTHNEGLNGTVTLIYTVKLKDSEKKAGEYSVALNDQATLNYRYSSWGDNYYSNSVDFPAPVAAVKAATLDIQVKDGSSTSPIGGGQQWLNLDSGNAFNLNDIPDIGDSYNGKWVESVTVTAKDGNRNIENVTIDDLNDPDPYAYTVTITLTDEEPGPVLDPQATPIKVRVMVDGEEMSAGANVGTYVTVSPDQAKQPASWDEASQGPWDPGTFHEESDTVTYDVTYYDCKDISFKATDGYVIEAVDADLVYGQSECKGITDNNGTVTADNVQGGSIVTVYVRTLYTIQYHNGESIITENTVNLVAETSSLEPKTPTVEKPIVDEEYDGEKYIQVGQEDTHAPATPSGKQAPSDFTYVNNELKTSEEIKALPTDDSGQLMYSGWYVGGSGNTAYLLAPGTEFQNGQYNFETYDKYDRNDNVINLYCTSAAARHQINISFEDDSQEPTTLKEMHIEEQSHNYQYNFAPSREENAVVPMTISYDSQTYVFDHFNGDNSGTLTEDVEFIAVYSVDSNNNGVPDKYEATVTYQVVNGTWSDGTSADKTATFAMRSFDSDSNTWVETKPVPTLDDQGNTIPTGMKPDIGYDANSGSWGGNAPTENTAVEDGAEYTYTFGSKLSYTLTVSYISDDGTALGKGDITQPINYGDSYDITDNGEDVYPQVISVGNDRYILEGPDEDSDPVSNESGVTGDVAITLVYTKDNWNDEEDTETGGDNIPDKYQAKVTYKVVGGTWSDGTDTNITEIFTLKTYNETTGQWEAADPTPTLGDSIPNGMQPSTGYVEPGNWDATISKDTLVTGNVTYTYTFPEASPGLTVVKDADEIYVNVGEEIHYTVTVENTGDVALKNVEVTDSLWKDGDVISVQVGEDADQDVTVSADSSVTIPEIPVGDSAKIIYTYTTTETGVLQTKVKP